MTAIRSNTSPTTMPYSTSQNNDTSHFFSYNNNRNGTATKQHNNNTAFAQQHTHDSQQQQQTQKSEREEWFSLEGYLYMKCQSGALTFLQSKKRLYFGLEEFENKLVYYRDKVEFNRKREYLGTIPLHNAVCSLIEGNLCAFVLHTAGKKYVMEADNARCANCWLNALQQRRDLSDNLSAAELPTLVTAALRRRRSRSRNRSIADEARLPNQIPTTPWDTTAVTVQTSDEKSIELVYSNRSGQSLAAPPKSASRQQVEKCEMNGATCETSTSRSLPGVFQQQLTNGDVATTSPNRKLSTRSGVSDAPAAWLSGWLSSWLNEQQQQAAAQQPSSAPPNVSLKKTFPKEKIVVDIAPEMQRVSERPTGDHRPSDDENLSHSDSNSDSAAPPICFTYEELSHDAIARRRYSRPMLRRISVQELAQNTSVSGLTRKPTKSTSALRDSPSPTSSCSSPSVISAVTATSPSATSASPNSAQFFDELSMLRIVDNRQKERIHELNVECTALLRELERLRAQQQHSSVSGTIAGGNTTDASTSLSIATQNRFLNAELLRVNNRRLEAENKVEQCNARIEALEAEMEEFKRQYVFLLQSCIRVPLHEHSSCDVVQVKLFGGDIHKFRVCLLLNKARETDPTLPTFESLTNSGSFHVDDYGFRHSYEEVPLALHYIATQLHEHYESQSEDYITLKSKWKDIFDTSPHFIERTRENRHLCRLGIPRALRSRVWRLLIHQQVIGLKAQYGEYYYRNLCSLQGTPAEKHYCSTHQKQINLDLLRTMPANIHFMSASCKGVTHLQAVLRAFCLHNPSTGYCQGMNFLAATALLFVSPEDAFWFLVAVTERYFHPSYFDQSLSGAQADQEVLKEIVEQKFPRLANHLEECDIDLTTITLNWFLALFFDAVPFQTMLRVWDCFLFEGPKVLFRFTIALLGLYQDEILDHTDTISVMKVLKAAVRLTYDIDGLIKYSFEELNPFPSKAILRQRHALYLEVLQEKLHKRLQLRKLLNVVSNPSSSDKICDLPIEVVVFSDFAAGRGYVCAGNEKRGKLSLISFHDEAANLNTLDIEFDCRPLSMVIFHEEMAFVSLLSGYIVAVQLHDDHHAEILWELKLNDVALKLLRCDNRLYSCLANGTLTILENAFEKMPSTLDLYHIPVSAAPITDALFDEENLYLAVACKIVILNRHTLHTTASVYVASSATGSQVPMFEKIRVLSNSEHGIWLITAHSSLLQLWRASECQMLFDITYDHSHRRPSLDDDDQFEQVEIYSIMYHENEVWIGTVDGYLMLYRVLKQSIITMPPMPMPSPPPLGTRRRAASASVASTSSCSTSSHMPPKTAIALAAAAAEKVRSAVARLDNAPSDESLPNSPDSQRSNIRYPPGKRLSPIQNITQDIPRHRQQMYYIPTDAETRVEESASVNEYPESERQTRKISVIIDQCSRKYSVNVKPLTRQMSEDVYAIRTPPPVEIGCAESKAQSDSAIKQFNMDSTLSAFSQTEAGRSKDTSRVAEDGDDSLDENNSGSETDTTRRKHSRCTETQVSRTLQASVAPPDVLPKVSAASYDTGFASGANSPPASSSSAMPLSAMGIAGPVNDVETESEMSYSRSCCRLVPQQSTPDVLLARGLLSDSVNNKLLVDGARNTLHNVGNSTSSGISCLPSFPSTIAEEESADVTATATPERDVSPTRTPFECAASSAPATLLTDAQYSQQSASMSPAADALSDVLKSNLKLRRKDLEFDESLLVAVNQSAGTSPQNTPGQESQTIVREEPEVKSSMGMALQMKLKISDKPVKCISLTKFNDEDVVVTGAGNYGDEEAILRWRREKNSGLWINDPLVDMCIRGRKRTLLGNAVSPALKRS